MSDLQSLLAHLPSALLVVFRIGGLMIYGPIFGSSVIPRRVKVFLAFLLGLTLYPVLATQPTWQEPVLTLSLWSLAPVIAMEVLIGLTIGFLASFPLIAVQTGGLVMGQQMGLGFARFFNPAVDDEADIVGQLLFFLALAGFLMVGGHEGMLIAVLNSFERVPAGMATFDPNIIGLVTGLLTSALELGLRVAAPLLALIFLESVAMGFIAKTVPTLNILSLGFPLRIIAGLAIIALGLAIIDEVILDGVDEVMNVIFAWTEGR